MTLQNRSKKAAFPSCSITVFPKIFFCFLCTVAQCPPIAYTVSYLCVPMGTGSETFMIMLQKIRYDRRFAATVSNTVCVWVGLAACAANTHAATVCPFADFPPTKQHSIAVKWVAFLLCIREYTGSSFLPTTGYVDCCAVSAADSTQVGIHKEWQRFRKQIRHPEGSCTADENLLSTWLILWWDLL
jgi:hypothetical protein